MQRKVPEVIKGGLFSTKDKTAGYANLTSHVVPNQT